MSTPTLTTRRGAFDTAEWWSTGLAVVVSGSLYVWFSSPYLARGVVGDLVGFGVLAVPLVRRRVRLRHEAMVCLTGIGVVHAVGPQWPLRVPDAAWWAVFAAGLTGYLVVRDRRLRRPLDRLRQPRP